MILLTNFYLKKIISVKSNKIASKNPQSIQKGTQNFFITFDLYQFFFQFLNILLNESFDYPHFTQKYNTKPVFRWSKKKLSSLQKIFSKKENTKWSHIISYLSQTVYLAFFLWILALQTSMLFEIDPKGIEIFCYVGVEWGKLHVIVSCVNLPNRLH